MKKFWQEWRGIILFVVFVITGFLVIYKLGIIDSFNVAELSQVVRDMGIWGKILYVITYILRPLVLFPATPLTLFGGYTFGAVQGTILDVIGAGTGALLAFWIARKLGKDKIERLIQGKKLEKFDHKLGENGFLVVLYLRLIPLFAFDSINYSMGLSSVRTRDYAAATYLGIIPGAFVLNFLGSSLGRLDWQFYTAIALYAFMIILPLIVKKLRNN
ncbi:TVP38/TMEM64 family protein [Listeria weihenstephanensis]|uniref:TVP38/TMEM64 family membrane protein n=1 Tax=Listeria weihenstephanensis TaxID=1006155 RepID=A0A841Z614_9LIST|nr:TVP38/TMEM64 family protein [Listeria weihenstephanensis]MBC1500658.1 TVP38/TMEM64 family protein [Listeria weihenstephanensis]